jgi:hypothetical protein
MIFLTTNPSFFLLHHPRNVMTLAGTRQGIAILLFGLFIGVSLAAIFQYAGEPPLLITGRLLALNGFVALCLGAILTSFVREVRIVIGRPFLSLHHTFAAVGLASITLHPVSLALLVASPLIFLPIFSSPMSFLVNGGRSALPLIYVALLAVLVRRKIPRYWNAVHALMYPAILIGLIHGNLVGANFTHPVVFFICNGLGILALATLPVRFFRRRAGRARTRQA